MIKVYLHRWGNSFEDTVASDPFPLVCEGDTLPEFLRLVLPSPTAKYISRTSFFELSGALKIDNCSVYVETEDKRKQP